MSPMEMMDPAVLDKPLCDHAPNVLADPRSGQCEECASTFNLRSCASCGDVVCCESQAGHARAHALDRHHPVIEQMTSGGPGFAWCYGDNRYVR